MSATTRDWLLQKLLKMRDSLTAVTRERDEARAQRDAATTNLLHERDRYGEDLRELHSRIHQMAPEKQFEVIYHTRRGDSYTCNLLSVESANGKTTIRVEWPGYNEPSIAAEGMFTPLPVGYFGQELPAPKKRAGIPKSHKC